MAFILYLFFFSKTLFLQNKMADAKMFMNRNNCNWNRILAGFDKEKERKHLEMFDKAKIVKCFVKILDNEVYESYVVCQNHVYYTVLENLVYLQTFNYKIESCLEKCVPFIELTDVHVYLDMKSYNVGEEGTYKCMFSDKEIIFQCKVGGTHVNGVKANSHIVNYICRSGFAADMFLKMFQNHLKGSYNMLLPYKGFPNETILCGLIQADKKDKINCVGHKLITNKGELKESQAANYDYCTSYCKLPEIDVSGIEIPETEDDILLNDQILLISCGPVSFHIICTNTKIYFLNSKIPLDVGTVLTLCQKGATMEYLRIISGKHLKPDRLNVVDRGLKSLAGLTDVRCKLVKNNIVTYSLLHLLYGTLYAKEDNNRMIEIIEYDEIAECTQSCTVENTNSDPKLTIEIKTDNTKLTDMLSVQCSGNKKEFYCRGNRVCEHEQDADGSCFGLEDVCARMGVNV